jgi:site-specific DNA-methyltransferase (adenine-specific)
MPALESVQAVITDPPYGMTACEWDTAPNLEMLWRELKRICGGAMVMTASQPFTSDLVVSNRDAFKCEWIWDKVNAANFANANRHPLKVHESVIVFCDGELTYNPQKQTGQKNHEQGRRARTNVSESRGSIVRADDDLSGMKYPSSILTVPKHSSQCGLHPTQKPEGLMSYLVLTYTNPGDTILDCYMGSGTTGVTAIRHGRNFIGIERDAAHYKTACDRFAHELNGALL